MMNNAECPANEASQLCGTVKKKLTHMTQTHRHKHLQNTLIPIKENENLEKKKQWFKKEQQKNQ